MLTNYQLIKLYAKAIFAVALEQNQYHEYLAIFARLVLAIKDQNVAVLMIDPRLSTKNKLFSLLQDCCGSKTPEPILQLLKLMIAKQKLMLLPEVQAKYEDLFAQYEKNVTVTAISARPLQKEKCNKLQQALEKRLRSTITLHYQLDPALIGGLVLHINNDVIDGSVRHQLQSLATQLKEHIYA